MAQPVVLDSGRISLHLRVEVSVPTQQAIQGLGTAGGEIKTTRNVSTTVELPSGGSFMIGGLLSSEPRTTHTGVPGLKDLPILGQLFRSTSFQRDDSELVVLVTPYLVSPIDQDKAVTPTDGFAPATDIDLFLLGRLQHVYGTDQPLTGDGGVGGPIGYIMR